jgi:hypothetical protein
MEGIRNEIEILIHLSGKNRQYDEMMDDIGNNKGRRHRRDPRGGEKPEQRDQDHATVSMMNAHSQPTPLDLP